MKSILTTAFFFMCGIAVMAQSQQPQYVHIAKTYRYRVYLNDKKNNGFSEKHPEQFLSPKAIDRRKKFKLKIDKHDLPVSAAYLNQLNQHNYRVKLTSKWNNTAVVEISDTTTLQALRDLPFVNRICKVWESPDSLPVFTPSNRFKQIQNKRDTFPSFYGAGQNQVEMLKADRLHNAGFKGEGITIAVIDGGFYNCDAIEGLKNCRILGTKNFVNPGTNVYEESQQHGTMVLSCIGANMPNSLVGTAPEASFYLLQSEDNAGENLIEEDYWCAAVEYADSIGVDIVTSSLGYYHFDDPAASHKYEEQDGQTALNSYAASLAASRGLLILNSAGNEGDNQWKKIGFPADAKNIITVGAVNAKGMNANFSSLGNTADGRIKPDVMAQGQNSALIDFRGNVTKANGTSFSTPILCGAVACLWQAFPKVRPETIIRAVQQSGNNHEHPNNVFGYGIPDMWKAYEMLKKE